VTVPASKSIAHMQVVTWNNSKIQCKVKTAISSATMKDILYGQRTNSVYEWRWQRCNKKPLISSGVTGTGVTRGGKW